MTFADLSPWANNLWQSTLFAAVAWLLTLALPKNRAAVRYWIWQAASAKFLIPFSLLVSAGAQLGWRTVPAVAQPRFFAALAIQAQQPDLAFEAASVKPSSLDQVFTTMQGGPGSLDPGRITYKFVNLRNVLSWAYDVGYDAVLGPQWLDNTRFDIVATMAHGTTKVQFRLMLLHLLEERFKLAAHRETKEMPGYALVVAKHGPILKEASEDPVSGDRGAPSEQSPAGERKFDKDGFPVMPTGPGVQQRCIEGGCRFRAIRASMEELAARLPCRWPIVDQTHLTGRYDFILTCDVGPLIRLGLQDDQARAADHPSSFPDVFHALQTQLGLKLERKNVPTRLVRVDHMEKAPVEN